MISFLLVAGIFIKHKYNEEDTTNDSNGAFNYLAAEL